MSPDALTKAESRYRSAEAALDRLAHYDSFIDFKDDWYVFLTAWKGILTTLEQGAKENAKSRQWFGSKKSERQSEPMLQYLFQARNDEEHGLSTTLDNAKFMVVSHLPGASIDAASQVRMEQDEETGEVQVIRADGGPVEIMQTYGPGPSLSLVKGRGTEVFGPPIEFRGLPIDITPLGVGRLGLAYVRDVLDEAHQI